MLGKLIYNLKQVGKKLLPAALLSLVRSSRRRLTAASRDKKRRTGRTIELADLIHDLATAGFSAGQMVMVHASLSSIGQVSRGATTVIQSWIDVITSRGTVIMPCYNSADEVERKLANGQLTDLRHCPALTGKISETFRRWPGVLRSSHPFSSACAWGHEADSVTSNHESAPYVCHRDSPVGKLVAAEGKVVGIGIPIAQGLGVAHYLEDTSDLFPFEVHSEPREIRYIDAYGKTITREICRYDPKVAQTRVDYPEGAWICEMLTRHFESMDLLHRFCYGDGEAWWMNARGLFDELQSLAARGITMYSTRKQLEKADLLPDNW